MPTMIDIAVVGSGYVGLVAAACFAELGHRVICVDKDPEKVAVLARGELPTHEAFLPELLARHRGNNLSFTTSLAEAVQRSQVIFFAVGTPSAASGEADLSYVDEVARDTALSLNGYKVVVVKSTVPVNTHDWIKRVMKLTAPEADFDVVSNPEFLREGSAVMDFLYPDRIVVGSDSPRAIAIMRRIFQPLLDGEYRNAGAVPRPERSKAVPQFLETSAKSAELIKHASNAFLAMKISFINAVANLCEAVGAEVEEVREGMGADSRIGSGFLRAGIGYGGSCFPKDVAAFRSVARESGVNFSLLDEIMKINDEQRQRFLRKVRTALWTLKGKRLAVLGLAFKGGTDDVRESPAIAIVDALLNERCEIVVYDPAAMTHAKEHFADRVLYAADPYEACIGADALLVLTDWEQFTALDLTEVKQRLKYPVVIDGRNLFSPEKMKQAGFMYISVGRAMVEPQLTGVKQQR